MSGIGIRGGEQLIEPMLGRFTLEFADIEPKSPQPRRPNQHEQCGFGLQPLSEMIKTLTNEHTTWKRTEIN